MLGLAAVPALIQFIGFLFLPETPRWLIQKERYDKAKKSLRMVCTMFATEFSSVSVANISC